MSEDGVIGPTTYRRLDQFAKLLGVLLVAVGLEVGGGTPTGFALGAAGVIVALVTVFVTPESDEDRRSRE